MTTALFFRQGDDGETYFYPIEFHGKKPAAEEAADHAALNPGTLRIEDIDGNVLWPEGTK